MEINDSKATPKKQTDDYAESCVTSIYDDDNIPEIDLPHQTSATNVIPDEVPRRDGPGGE